MLIDYHAMTVGCLPSTGEGAGGNTRGRVCSPMPTAWLRVNPAFQYIAMDTRKADFALYTGTRAAYKLRMSESHQPAINAATRCCAVYGFPIRHSASPAMHNAAFAALGLNWRYLAFEVHPDNLRAAIAGAKAMQFAGLNLTVPHKVLALEMVDALDESAKTWGAVNTIRFEGRIADGEWRPLREFVVPPSGGPTQLAEPSRKARDGTPNEIRAHGFNTDADGIAGSLREDLGLALPGAKVLLIGTGGAGQVAALRLALEKVSELFLFDFASAKAEAVAQEIRRRYPQVKVTVGFPKGPVDLLLNATPLGLKPGDASPVDEKQFPLRQARAVYDMVYNPPETALLKAAKAAGCKTANGLGMLLRQGAKAFEIWTGKAAPLDVMRRALEAEVYQSTVHSPQSAVGSPQSPANSPQSSRGRA
jgi:shikimate dehydrogenase